MSFIVLEHQKISFSEIRNGMDETAFGIYTRQVLLFCRSWLRGDHTFEISTSGSTGNPQNITWTRELMLWSIRNTANALQLHEAMHCLHCIDASKAGGKMMLARALQLGMSLEVVEPSSDPFYKSTSTHFDFGAMVPLQIHQLYSANKLSDLNKIDTLIIGGASLNTSLNDALQKVNTKIFATYGMTETASHIALQRINGAEKQEAFIAFPDVSITTDEEQCAIISTPFHDGLQTNDIIKINPDHSFSFLGRRDHTINSGGYKIAIEKVEAAIDRALTALKINFYNYCVYRQNDEKLGEALMVIFETEAFDVELLTQLKQELGSYLHPYEMPKKFYYIQKLAYTSSGKIDRKASAAMVL